MALLYIGLFLLLCTLVLPLRIWPSGARMLYRVLLVLSVAPYLVLVWYLWRSISGLSAPQETNGIYPGLVAFATAGVLLVLGLLALAWWGVTRAPLLTAPLPVGLGGVFWFGLFPLLDWKAPGLLFWDNMPLIWIAGFSVIATLCLAVVAAFVLPRRSRALQA